MGREGLRRASPRRVGQSAPPPTSQTPSRSGPHTLARADCVRASSEMTGYSFARAPAVVALALAAILSTPPPPPETLSNIPPTLSGGDGKQQVRIKHPKSAKALQCTSKCVATCIRGGEGPLNVRRPLVVFKEQFRSRQYCLAECSDVCNLIKDGEDGQ
ncbi:hypothetical protein GUJ93_ZPchr0006g44303 [Zizania palustris]|uniref:Uncharacterized protein n=1 Tax=Zizania palustris TaxID=103762 RepID=A0A8J5W434_ZIZPA|nr:hypothetical protein GUJ93_ZPchr0006g44303 [Zizania palustris]KAG8074720.1 hypothetical protein GUJ93_ZPchr0006g44303 [Zizania palustris]